MSGLLKLLHEQDVTGASSVVIAHGLNRAGLLVQLILANGDTAPESIELSSPSSSDPLNSLDLTFTAPVTGRVQILGASGDFAQLPSVHQAVQLAASAVYGSEHWYAEVNAPNTHTSTSLRTALQLGPTVQGGTYRVEWYYEWAMNSTSRDFIAQIDADGSVLAEHRQEPKDSSGSSRSGSWSGTDQSHPASGFWEGALAAGARVVTLGFATSDDEEQATVYRARLSMTRVA